jgi:CIC family chloride channel protein
MRYSASQLLLQRARLGRLFNTSEWQTMLFWATTAGLLGVAATQVFRLLIYWGDFALLGKAGSLVDIARHLPPWARIAAPTVGGLAAGALLMLANRASWRKARSDYMEAIMLGDGRIPVAQTLARSASSLVSIASGGSIGREGSMVQLAALCASLLGRLLRFPVDRLRLLVACGAAAGLTAAYNAPIASTFFVAEIVLGSIAMESLGPVLIAAVVANIAMRTLPGYEPPYAMPAFPTVKGAEVFLFVMLGLLLGSMAALFLRALRWTRDVFKGIALPLPLQLGLGGLIVGLISAGLPEVWGNGYSVVNSVLHDDWPWKLLLLILAAKAVATLATVGSGAVGGVFTPALFFGCVLGAVFGQAAHQIWPTATSAPFAYAIVGMGAFLAGTTQAPLMAILMIFEMTLSYQVMLPLMASSVVAYFIVRSTRSGSMYEITEYRNRQQAERLRLRTSEIHSFVQPANTVVKDTADVQQMSALFLAHPIKYVYVVDSNDRYLGVVALRDLTSSMQKGSTVPCAGDLLSDEITPLTQDMLLGAALQRFIEHQGERLPVVRSTSDPVLLGVVHKTTLLQTYVRLSE